MRNYAYYQLPPPHTGDLTDKDVLLIDNPTTGTHTLPISDISLQSLKTIPNSEIWDLIDRWASFEQRKNIFRGKYLGTEITDEQYAHIKDGTFKGMFVGDYWYLKNGWVWRIYDMDYWRNKNDQNLTEHHLIMMSDGENISNARMNPTNSTEGGYIGSEMHLTTLESIREYVFNTFGEAHILKYRRLFTNSVNANGMVTGSVYKESTVDLPDEIMILGSKWFAQGNVGSIIAGYYNQNTEQLAGIRLNPASWWRIRHNRWLCDVADKIQFSSVSSTGNPTNRLASQNASAQVVFGLIG